MKPGSLPPPARAAPGFAGAGRPPALDRSQDSVPAPCRI